MKILYFRKLKSFRQETLEFLKSNHLEFVEERRPNNKEWEKSPYQKPPAIKGSLFTSQINGSPVTWTESSHKIIVGKRNNDEKKDWREIKTTYFKKPELKFIKMK